MNSEIYRQVIMDHYKNPNNKTSTEIENYKKKEALNPSCGDRIEVYIDIENNKVVDIKWNGDGCSICCSSASVMSEELKNLEFDQIIKKIDDFDSIITGKEVEDIGAFEDAQAFSGVQTFPARYKCAYISWDTVKKIITEEM